MAPLELPTGLADGRVLLRGWSPDDLPTIADFGLDPANVRWGDVPAGRQVAAARAWMREMERYRRDGRGLSLAVVEASEREVVGNLDLRFPLPRVGELGFLLVPRARGRGLMSGALRLVVAWAFAEHALGRIQAFVSPDNERSARLLSRLGFVREGVLRSYRGPGRDRVAFSLLPGRAWIGASRLMRMHRPMHLLLISGSLRDRSTNTAVLRTASVVAPTGVTTSLYGGMATLPHFNPDDDREGAPVHPAVAELRGQIAAADALLLCTPEYAGALPGALKNLLEWTVGDAGTYRKPVALINASGPAAPTGAADAHDSLRKVLGYVHAEIVEAACARIPVTRDAVGPDGTLADPALRERIAETLGTLARHVATATAP